MENKINLVEILRDCPTGMELDCSMWDNVTFIGIEDIGYTNILIKTPCGQIKLSKEGYFSHNCNNAKCVIFPKGKDTWEGFVPPCKSKKESEDEKIKTAILNHLKKMWGNSQDDVCGIHVEDAITWLENQCKQKINDKVEPKFHEGEWITNGDYIWKIVEVTPLDYILQSQNGNIVDDTISHVDEQFYIWDEFASSCKFKDGDIISDSLGTCIFKGEGTIKGTVDYYCGICGDYFHVKDHKQNPDVHFGNIDDYRFATEEEKQKLFDIIKAHGYCWGSKTKTLEKLITPIFKVGDRIKYRGGEIVYRIVHITEDSYVLDNLCSIPILIEHMYNLVPDEFNIATLTPFESRVLVRDYSYEVWRASFWGCLINSEIGFIYDTTRGCYKQCIPYEGNEHLLGKTDDCDSFYKTWSDL